MPAVLFLLIVTSCRKVYTDEQVLPAHPSVTDSLSEEEFIPIPHSTEPQFPGGIAAWHQFLQEHLVALASNLQDCVEGAVVVQFVIDTNGSVCDVKAVSGPAELQQMAVDVIKQSPKWIPVSMGSYNVKIYKRQPITFRFEEE